MRLGVCLTVVFLGVCAPGARAGERSWGLLEHASGWVGQIERERDAADGVLVTRQVLRLSLRTPTGLEPVVIETLERETSAGTPLGVERHTRIGRVRSGLSVVRDGAWLRVTRTQAGASEERRLAVPEDWRLSAGLEPAIAALVESGGGSVRYRELDLDRVELASVELALDPRAASPPGSAALLRRVASGEIAHESAATWLVRERRMRTSFRLWGQLLEVRECEGRCGPALIAALDPMDFLSVRSPYRIPRAALRGTVRYVLASASGAALAIPQTGEQSVARREDRTIVTICAGCGVEESPSRDELARLRAPTLWLQSDHPQIRSLSGADREPAADPEVTRLLPSLVKRVQRRLDRPRWDPAFASALEAARSREGDCTEFAVLLAALARARGVPARVVMGLAYASRFSGRSHVFSPHAWAQVWDGRRWLSFDAAIEPFDAGHIALAVGNGNPEEYAEMMGLLPDLRILDAARIDAAPAR